MKYLFVKAMLFLSVSALGQSTQPFHIQLQDTQTNEPIPYAHIVVGDRLVAITDYFGNARITDIKTEVSYKISSVGYRSMVLSSAALQTDQINIIKLTPDQKILDAVTITPTTLEDMIREVYENIPTAYVSKPHLLGGELVEKYMDTLSHAQITSKAQIQAQKASYREEHNKGEVRMDSLSKTYDVTQPLQTRICAGAHIPHRFDFVMKREDFINPSSFHKYEYTYLGERKVSGREIDVIDFKPKSSGIVGGQFKGRIYLDMNEKVFIKAEYQYTKSGFFSHAESRWADQRMFITEYKRGPMGWFFSYTWDEAINYKRNFLLSQYFQVTSVQYDTIVDWGYDEKTHFHDVIEMQEPDTLITLNNSSETNVYVKSFMAVHNIISRLEIGLGLKVFDLNQVYAMANGAPTFEGNPMTVDQTFSIPKVDIGLFMSAIYRLTPNFFARLSQSETFFREVKKGHWDIGIGYRLRKDRGRPLDFNFFVGYGEYTSRFKFNKQAGVRPFFQQRHRGVTGGLSYGIRLNAKWKLGMGYSYFYTISTKEKFYLKEHYGFLDILSKKHQFDPDIINWNEDGEVQNDALNIFNNHSFDISLILAIE